MGIALTYNKNRRESASEAKFRKALSFSAFQFRVMSYEFAIANVWANGGEGGIELANKVLKSIEKSTKQLAFTYEDDMPLKDKINAIATKVYGADGVSFSPAASKTLDNLQKMGFGNMPVCMAKTQYSLSDDQTKLGKPENFKITVRELKLSAGAGFVVALTGNIMTMPGLPKKPAANNIDCDNNGNITGLF